MKTALLAFVLFLTALAAVAQEDPAKPDYSRDGLLRLFATSDVSAKRPKSIEFHAGYVDFRALNMRWRFAFLPFLAPFPGSVRGTVPAFPDPFLLTHTEIPYTPRTWRDQRAYSGELKRIEKSERERARVVVKPE
jgi:hypothetical protein